MDKEGFEFGVSHFSAEYLTNVKHDYELVASDKTYVSVDYKQSGMGSASCAVELNEKWRLAEKQFRFSFSVMPVDTGSTDCFDELNKLT